MFKYPSFFLGLPSLILHTHLPSNTLFQRDNPVTYSMNKRKQTHDYSTGHGSGAAVTPTPSKKLKRLTRHMYTNEQQRFIWYHRDILKMSAKEVHKSFYDYFSTEVAVSVDGLNQLAGRLRRVQSPEVVSAKNTEIWAIPVSHGVRQPEFLHN